MGKGSEICRRERNTPGIPVPVPTRSRTDHIFPTPPLLLVRLAESIALGAFVVTDVVPTALYRRVMPILTTKDAAVAADGYSESNGYVLTR